MNIVKMPLSQLKPAPYNPRVNLKPGDIEYEKLKRSIAEFGYVEPVIWNKTTGYVVGGHQRVKVLSSMGAVEVDVVVVELDDKKERALNVALNKISGSWDFPLLKELLVELDDGAFDLNLTGFDSDELKKLIDYEAKPGAEAEAEAAAKAEDDVPELPKSSTTKRGDVFVMGEHRLICGDCRVEGDMEKLFGAEKMRVAVTSPPYASQRKYDEASGFKPIHPDEYVAWWESVQAGVAKYLTDDGSMFVNIKEHCEDGQRHLYVKDLVTAHVRTWGWKFIDEFVWTHGGTPKAVAKRFKNGWEPIFQFTKGDHAFFPKEVRYKSDVKLMIEGCGLGDTQGKAGQCTGAKENEDGMAYPSNVISCGKNKEALGHSAAFPVGLPEFFIRVCSEAGDIVFDPFTGSGTTLIAAEKHKRRFFGSEISPIYCDVIVSRWEKFTGKKAELLRGE